MIELIVLLAIMFVLSLLANMYLLWRVLFPLRDLTARAARLAEGDFTSMQMPCDGTSEIQSLRRFINGMVGHVRRAQVEHRAYTEALVEGQEAERTRIAHELHDETVQGLIAVAQSIDLARNWLAQDASRAGEMLTMARTQAAESAENLRNLIADLRPPALEELGLVPALQMLSERSPSLDLSVIVEGMQRRLDAVYELTLFRCAQEALSNAHRHGSAKDVHFYVIYQEKGIRLSVEDNGMGFETSDLDTLAQPGHYGLLGIRERVQHLNGTVNLVSTPGAGTRLDIYVPYAETQQPQDVVRDPVCSALIQPQQAYSSVVHEGQRYYFCCPVCQGAFQSDPASYLSLPHQEAGALQ